ncbi:hypothetical protein ABIB62_000259 [Mucilaginibacter sp. UYP25]|uniref:hypothetical protein n=1 Tax=unclassified Mucilaginibacter TaxID=2617802 RepID=UPI003395C9D4
MLIVLAALVSLALLVLFFYAVIPKSMPLVFWGKVELFWVMISFLSVLYGTMEVLKIDKRTEYEELHNAAKIDFEEAQILIGEHLPVLDLHHPSAGQKTGLEWFHTMVNLMDEGYESRKWEDFANYTKGFLFKTKGISVNEHIRALKYHWPEDPQIKTDDIAFKRDIKLIADKLEAIEREKEQLLKQAPSNKPVTWPRYIIALVFLIGLSLKVLKIRHESYR